MHSRAMDKDALVSTVQAASLCSSTYQQPAAATYQMCRLQRHTVAPYQRLRLQQPAGALQLHMLLRPVPAPCLLHRMQQPAVAHRRPQLHRASCTSCSSLHLHRASTSQQPAVGPCQLPRLLLSVRPSQPAAACSRTPASCTGCCCLQWYRAGCAGCSSLALFPASCAGCKDQHATSTTYCSSSRILPAAGAVAACSCTLPVA